MSRKTVSAIMLSLLIVSTLTLAFKIQIVRADDGTIYINADGSITPSTAPIYTADNITYTLTGNISSPAYDGIVVERNNTVIDGNGYILQGNDTSSVSSGPGLGLTSQGLSLTSMINVTIKNLNIKGFQDGIYLNSTSETVISGNNLVANSVDGIYLEGSTNNAVSQNNVTANGYDGIALCYSSNGNVVSSNNSTANGDDGISLSNYSPFHVQYYNVWYPGSSNNTVSRNNATANSYNGIALQGSSNNTVYGNNAIENGEDGISVGSSSSIISGNNVTANENHGIYLSGSSNNTVSGNNATSNNDGIYLIYSSGNVLFDNVMEDNSVGNFGVDGSSPSQFVNWVDTTNLVNGAPVFYVMDKSNLLINPENYPDIGYLALVNCANITVQDLTFAHSPEKEGILLVGTNDSRISNNVVANDDEGIWLYFASNDIISGNILTANIVGIDLWDSSNNNTIDGNNATSNNWGIAVRSYCSGNDVSGNSVVADSEGISISGSNNIFSGNYIAANTITGLWFFNSGSDNIVSDNNITANAMAIQFIFSASDTIYHNNFVGNAAEVSFYDSNGQTWDDGYPSGGNYWSDYKGTDLYSGPYQNGTGSDGKGDTSYVIDGNNMDHYPLMKPYAPHAPLFGDINNDGKVDMIDIGKVASSFGSSSGELRWNPLADINLDGKVDLSDIALVAKHFGDHYP